jgi:hypothetical protein
MRENFIKTFEYIYSRVFRYNDYCFIPSENQVKQIDNFIAYLDKQVGLESIGEEWVYNFMVFGFKQRTEQKTRYNKIPLNWIIGKKAYILYEKRGENWLYFNGLFEKQYNLSFERLKPLTSLKNDDYYDNLRAKNWLLERPLSMCLNVVNYDRMSKYCMRCKDKGLCKLIAVKAIP